MAIEELGARFREVLHEVKAIRHLDGLRCPLPGAVGIGFRTIPA